MRIDLAPWFIAWAVVTTGVLPLLAWRLLVAKEEHGGIYIVEGEEPLLERQTSLGFKLARIDLWGKTLTVLSVILMLVIGSAWLYNGWLKSNEVVR